MGGFDMKEYKKPEVKVVVLHPEEQIANSIPTVVDEDFDELSIPNDFGNDFWD